MTNERGLIALAAIFFASGNPYAHCRRRNAVRHGNRAIGSPAAVNRAAPQLLQLIPYVVTVLALVIVGWRTTVARSRHGAWRFDIT